MIVLYFMAAGAIAYTTGFSMGKWYILQKLEQIREEMGLDEETDEWSKLWKD